MTLIKATSGPFEGYGLTRAEALSDLLTHIDVPIVTLPLPVYNPCEVLPRSLDLLEIIR